MSPRKRILEEARRRLKPSDAPDPPPGWGSGGPVIEPNPIYSTAPMRPPMGDDTVRGSITRAMDMEKIRRAAKGAGPRPGAGTAAIGAGIAGIGGGLMAYDAMKKKSRARR